MLQSTRTLPWMHQRHTSARCSAKKASSPIGTEALNLSFQGLKQTQCYQCASFLLHIHQRAAVRLPPASGRWQHAALPLPLVCGGQRRQHSNLALIASHFPLRSDAGWMVKWNTHTKNGTHRQKESQNTYTSVEATRHEAIFHCYYNQTQRAECSHTTDLNSRSPLGKEQVCVIVWSCLLLHVCFSTCARTCPSTLNSSTAQIFLLTGITVTVSVSSSMMAPVNYAPHKNLTLTRLVVLQVNAMSQKCGLIGRQCEWQELQGILRQMLRTRTLYIEHGWGLHFFRWSAKEEEACLEITEQIPFNTWIFVFKN